MVNDRIARSQPPTYIPTKLPTYLLTYLPTCLPTYLPTFLPTFLLDSVMYLPNLPELVLKGVEEWPPSDGQQPPSTGLIQSNKMINAKYLLQISLKFPSF